MNESPIDRILGGTLDRAFRHRVNVSQTSTGKKGFDCTVEGTGYTREEILNESDKLVKELEKRYPPEIKKGG